MQRVKREEGDMMGEAEIPASSLLQHIIFLSHFSIERHIEGLQVTV